MTTTGPGSPTNSGGGRRRSERALIRELRELNRNVGYWVQQMRLDKNSGSAAPGMAGMMPGGGPAAGGAGKAAGVGGAVASMGAKAGMGPVGWGLAALQLIELPILLMALFGSSQKAGSGVSDLNATLSGLKTGAMSASSALSQVVIELKHISAEVGTTMQEIFTTTSAFSAVGSPNPLADAEAFAKNYGRVRRGLVSGQPDQGYLLGASMLGMNPMDILRQTPSEYQMSIVQQLRQMGPERRNTDFIRAALERAVGTEDMADILRLSEMDDRRFERFERNQRQIQERAGPYLEGLGRFTENIESIEHHTQMRSQVHGMQIEYLRRGGGEDPIMAQFRSDIKGGGEKIGEEFWKEMAPGIAAIRDLFGFMSENGKLVDETFGFLAGVAKIFAQVLKTVVGLFIVLVATFKTFFDVLLGLIDIVRALVAAAQGDFPEAKRFLKSSGTRFVETAKMYETGYELMGLTTYDRREQILENSPLGNQANKGSDIIHIALDKDLSQIATVMEQDQERTGRKEQPFSTFTLGPQP